MDENKMLNSFKKIYDRGIIDIKNYFTFYSLQNYNNKLTECILNKISNKKMIGTQLTAGKDSRAILSILLKNKIKPDIITKIPDEKLPWNIYDVETAKKISNDFNLNFITIKNKEYPEKIIDQYDIIIGGLFMSEFADNRFIWLPVVDKMIVNFENSSFSKDGVHYYPMIETRVLAAAMQIPFYLCVGGFVNRYIIKKNMKSLMNYPFNGGRTYRW